jgi:HAD superfamily hydrolase (TIGR01484 family)
VRPLAKLSASRARALRGVLFDLDDTVLSHGRLELRAYAAICRATESGLLLGAVTGRPCAWGEVLARQWPVRFVVVENGALAIVRDGAGVRVLDPCDLGERRRRVAALRDLEREMKDKLPELLPADDAWCRRTDTTWDIGERDHASAETVVLATEIIHRAGAATFASSVHLHASFDRTDKAQGAVRFLRHLTGEDESSALHAFAFVGDSGNDGPCFSAFHTTFGVANVRRHASRMSVPPRWVATAEMGEGFAEIIDTLLALRLT